MKLPSSLNVVCRALPLVFCLFAIAALAQEPEGSTDHPLLSRFPGSTIVAYDRRAHDQTFVPSMPSHADGDWVAGRFTWIAYQAPSNSSPLQLYRNYEKALNSAGFSTTFTCRKDACGRNFVRELLRVTRRYIGNRDKWIPRTAHYLAAKALRDEKSIWVSVLIYEMDSQGLPIIRLEIIEENEPRSLDMLMGTQIGSKEVVYDEAKIATGSSNGKTLTNVLNLEGQVDWKAFRYNRDVSAYEAFAARVRNTTANQYQVSFSCGGRDCGRNFIRKTIDLNGLIAEGGERWSQDSGYYFHAVSKASGVEKNVSFLSYHQPDGLAVSHSLVVTSEIPDFDQVTVNAEAMAQTLEETGRVAVYGIYFETNNADVTPASRPTLDDIVRLLELRPGMSLYVDGHTDNQGADDYNLDLSRRRAGAVVDALVNAGVEVSRLEARGFGAGSPIESNDTMEGRAKNRRVELVAK